MTKKVLMSVLVVSAVLLYFLPAFSQEDIKFLQDEAFTNAQRPAAVFNHDEHNEMAEIEDCMPCHHEGKDDDGNLIEGDYLPCADCHEVNPDEGTPLMLAYHIQCENCHIEKKKGPVTCGECHVK